MNTYQDYIFKQIKRLNAELKLLFDDQEIRILEPKQRALGIPEKDIKKPEYTEAGWDIRFYSIASQIDILYMVLTGHDNKYNEK